MTERRKRIAVVALGAALSLLLGSGLFALAQDAMFSSGNVVQSGTFTAITGHDVKWARVSSSSSCAGATYGDGPMGALISTAGATIDLQGMRGTTETDVVCIKNAGTQTGKVVVDFNTIGDQEVGTCQASESAAGDDTCTDGQSGELRAVLVGNFIAEPGGTGTCDPPAGSLTWSALEVQVPRISSSLAPGQYCIYRLSVQPSSTATDDQKLLAQTDRVQWDITFFLQDQP